MAIKKELSKDDLIKKEFNKLKRIFKILPKDKMNTTFSLMRNAAFMIVTLDELQKEITKNGVISEYKNGENQYGTKKSPEIDVYNTMIKNHLAIIKQLCDLLPENEKETESDKLMNFVMKQARK